MIVYTVIDCFIIVGVIFLLNEKMQRHFFKNRYNFKKILSIYGIQPALIYISITCVLFQTVLL